MNLLSFFPLLFILPPEFSIVSRTVEHRPAWEFTAAAGRFASLKKTVFSPALELFDENERLLVRVAPSAVSGLLGSVITNEREEPLGSIQEKGGWLFKDWKLYDQGGQLLASSDMNWYGTQFEIHSASDHRLIARLEKPLFRFSGSKWSVSVGDCPPGIDPLLLFTFIAYHTEYDS